MIPGLILLVLLSALVAPAWIRLRRRLGLGVSIRHWAVAAAVFAIAVIALWVTA